MQDQDVGIKLSQPGFNVQDCPDYKLIFNSSWPVLKIIHQEEFLIPISFEKLVLYEHNLGYTPMFLVFEKTSIGGWRIANNNFYGIQVDKRYIYTGFSGVTNNVRIILFSVDLDKSYTAPSIFTEQDPNPTPVTREKNFGIKITKSGKDSSSTDFRDYIIHSACRSPMLHSVNPFIEDASVGFGSRTYSFPHNMGHAPMMFAYYASPGDPTGGYIFADISPASSSGFNLRSSSTEVTLSFSGSFRPFVSVVVLKDPIFID